MHDIPEVPPGDTQMRRIVENLYLGLLERVGEPEGVDAHTEALLGMGGIDSLHVLIRNFLDSGEYRARTLQYLRSTSHPGFRENEKYRAQARLGSFTDFMLRPAGVPPLETVHHVVGIGWACLTASILRRWKMRTFSAPFDWIFSSAEIVRHAIIDDFATFLDRSQYVDYPPLAPELSPRTQHRLYGSMLNAKWAPVFNHHDPMRSEADYETFLRHVDHFRKAIHGPHNTLLVHMAWNEPGTRRSVERLIEYLDAQMPNVIMNTFLLEEPQDAFVPRLIPMGEYGRHRILNFVPTSEVIESGFMGTVDEIGMIRTFSVYDFDLQSM
jgi:hypothetical protein